MNGKAPAKVFALFPIVLISVTCSVCYRCCMLEPEAGRDGLTVGVRSNEITR